MQIRQGDVLLVRVDAATEARLARHADELGVQQRPGHLVLAEGEATGHAHVIEEPTAALVTDEEAEELFLLVHGTEPVSLRHQEHDPLEIPPGVYRVVRQREYDELDDWSYIGD